MFDPSKRSTQINIQFLGHNKPNETNQLFYLDLYGRHHILSLVLLKVFDVCGS